MFKVIKGLVLSLVLCLLFVGNAMAVFSPTGTADLAPVEAWLGIAVVAYLALFGYRKFIKSANRS